MGDPRVRSTVVTAALGLALALGCAHGPDDPGDMVVVGSGGAGAISPLAAADGQVVRPVSGTLGRWDVSDPTAVVSMGTIGGPYMAAAGVLIDGDRLITWGGTMHVYDRSTEPPTWLASVDADEGGNGQTALTVRDDVAYVVDADLGIRTYALPGATLLGATDFPGEYVCEAGALSPDGAYLYVGCTYGLHVVDVSDPADPVEVALDDTILANESMLVVGSRLYAGNWTNLVVLDLSDPAAPVAVDDRAHDHTGLRTLMSFEGQLWAGSTGGVLQFDLSDPDHPELDHWLQLDRVTGLAVSDGVLLAGAYDAIYVIDPHGR